VNDMWKDVDSEGNQQTDDQVQRVVEVIMDVLCNPNTPGEIPDNVIKNVALRDLYACLNDIREAVIVLSRGELSKDITGNCFVVGHLKELQANLRHLTWQTKRISQGDLTQRVDFMGEFAESFNSMVQSLAIARADLEKLALFDSLTGCTNRHYFFRIGSDEVKRAQRHKHPVSILALDMDHFKIINDTFGHSVGDQVLRVAADIFRKASRTNDIIGRIGGEEFAIILPETTLLGALTVAERILSDCRSMNIVLEDSRIVHFTISIGLACAQEHEWGFEQLLQHADKALYAAKQAGRDRISIFTE